MRAEEFLLEDDRLKKWHEEESNKNLANLKQAAELIKKDCQPFLREAQPFNDGEVLLRGLNDESRTFVKKRIRLDNRTPKDMPQELHDRINQHFTKKYGAPFRNAMFCTGDYNQADNYGNIYMIFPVGNFKYLWGEESEDLFMLYDEYAPWFKPGSDVPEEEKAYKSAKAMEDFYRDEIAGGTWHNSNIKNGIDYGNEIMVRAESYYAVNFNRITQHMSTFLGMLK